MNKAKNLEEAVLAELEKQDIFPIKNVTGHLSGISRWTREQLDDAVNKAYNTLNLTGDLKASMGLGRNVAAYIRDKNKHSLKGKEV